jgi:diacylglycerol kinase (ATP)
VSAATKGQTGIRRIVKAFGYSTAGLAAALKHEAAFRQEAALAVVFVPIGLYAGRGGVAKALLVGSVLLVLIVELLNSGLEATIDRISTEHHHLSKLAKDAGSAAVFMALAMAVLVWGLVLLW